MGRTLSKGAFHSNMFSTNVQLLCSQGLLSSHTASCAQAETELQEVHICPTAFQTGLERGEQGKNQETEP
jgi:hypothetical protein